MIQYAILGLLSWKPMTGYDLKQIFRSSLTMYWSGGNNQIYRTLVHLHEDKLVTRDIEQPDAGPSRKVYSITPAGEVALQTWVKTTPQLPEIKHAFLIQLAWADQLTDEALDALLAEYEEEVTYRWIMQHEQAERDTSTPQRTQREKLLWASIDANWIGTYQHELDWVRKLRAELKDLSNPRKNTRSDTSYKFTP